MADHLVAEQELVALADHTLAQVGLWEAVVVGVGSQGLAGLGLEAVALVETGIAQ